MTTREYFRRLRAETWAESPEQVIACQSIISAALRPDLRLSLSRLWGEFGLDRAVWYSPEEITRHDVWFATLYCPVEDLMRMSDQREQFWRTLKLEDLFS
jgi:hypothetical protein